MVTRRARWWLVWTVMGALLAAAAAGMLWAAERAAPSLPVIALRKNPAALPRPPALPAGPKEAVLAGKVQIAAPESGAKLRGDVMVRVDWPKTAGYVVFRVDDGFVYSTTAPYEMRWDTSTARDGEHILTVDAYDSSAKYAGSSSISVVVENSMPSPSEGVLLAMRFGEHDLLKRRVSARGELSALRAGEALPQGFDVLAGELRSELTQSVLDTAYEGLSTLMRNRLRTGSLIVGGIGQSLPEEGQYAVVQISRNGLTLPAPGTGSKPRVGIGEICLALPDYPLLPGDSWQQPVGAVCELYTRRAVFVQARHTFEGLRWYRGHECAVITSSYSIPELPLLTPARQEVAAAGPALSAPFVVELTQMRGGPRGGGGGRGGGFGMRGARGGRMGGGTGAQARGARGTAAPGTSARPGAPGSVEQARLVGLEGTRTTYVTRQTGRVLHTEDTLVGKLEFRAGYMQTASARGLADYTVDLTAMRGGGGMMRGGARGAMGGMGAGTTTTRRAGTAAAQRPGGAQAGGEIPASLSYGFAITTDLVIE